MVMFESERDDFLWEMWMSNPFREGSFNDFKEESLKGSTQKESKNQKEAEALSGMNKALEMLGGDIVGG